MTRADALLSAVSSEPSSTQELYERVGYPTLTLLGLVSYHAVREELVKLERAGLVVSESGRDGSTTWRLHGSDESQA